MKKILIALPLVLVMLLSMIPVMAAGQVPVSITVDYYAKPGDTTADSTRSQTVKADKDVASDAKKLEAFVKATVEGWGYPNNKYYWKVEASRVQVYKETLNVVTETMEATIDNVKAKHANSALVDWTTVPTGMTHFTAAGLTNLDALTGPGLYTIVAADVSATPATLAVKTQNAQTGQDAEVDATVKPSCDAPETTTVEKCYKPCEEITVELLDVHNDIFLTKYTKVYSVNPNKNPDRDTLIKLYMDEFFPWNAYQPLKNYLNQYEIYNGRNFLENCTITISVLPKYEQVQIIHELYDCCITADGDVKKELIKSFIEDDEAYNARYGTPDGLVEIPFLEYHTGLVLNKDKAAEYAKTRIEKMNAGDFVFQDAIFYDGVKASDWVKGVYNVNTGQLDVIKNDVPTIVIKYLRAECVKTDEKVDDVKVVAGQASTTPVQQLPATGAKDVTAFFMSAVALLGLGIFFAKKH